MTAYRISQLAERCGVPATTLRFYEKEGLLPAARTPSGYRAYTDSDVDRVRFISAAKHLGLSLERIRDLLSVWAGGRCRDVRDELRPMVVSQIAAADGRIGELRASRDRLDGALLHLHALPPRDGPCDPGCSFLQDRPPQPVACSLGAGQYSDRVERWAELLGDAPRTPSAGGRITVRLPAEVAGVLAELVVAEQECCPFLEFRMDFAGAEVELTARAPEMAWSLLEALFGPVQLEESR